MERKEKSKTKNKRWDIHACYNETFSSVADADGSLVWMMGVGSFRPSKDDALNLMDGGGGGGDVEALEKVHDEDVDEVDDMESVGTRLGGLLAHLPWLINMLIRSVIWRSVFNGSSKDSSSGLRSWRESINWSSSCDQSPLLSFCFSSSLEINTDNAGDK